MQPVDSEIMAFAQRSPQRPAAVLERDAALARVGRLRRLVIFGSAALSAAFAGLVSTTPLGKASPRTTARTAPSTARASTRSAQAPSLPPLANANQLGLQGPTVAPSAPADNSGAVSPSPADSSQSAPVAPQPAPPVVSGGS